MSNRKQIYVALSVLATAVAIFTIILCTEGNTKAKAPETSTTEKVIQYTVKDYNGQLAVFLNDEPSPIKTFELYTKSLPKIDAEQIQNGITVNSEAELNKLLEEYLS